MAKKPILNILVLLSLSLTSSGQGRIDTVLKARLNKMMENDQRYRVFLYHPGPGLDSLSAVLKLSGQELDDHLFRLQGELDSLNMLEISAILDRYSYPGPELVGKPTNEVIYYILQHSDSIGKYYPVIADAADNHKIPFTLAAMMHDRLLVQQNKEQLYGTQAEGFYLKNPKTGEKEMNWFIWPIKDADKVNARRKKAGFTETIEKYAEDYGGYRKVTLKDIERMRLASRRPEP